jgi:hypothetical protein
MIGCGRCWRASTRGSVTAGERRDARGRVDRGYHHRVKPAGRHGRGRPSLLALAALVLVLGPVVARADVAPTEPTQAPSSTVLLVSADEVVARALARSLEGAGGRVVRAPAPVAQDPSEAQAAAASARAGYVVWVAGGTAVVYRRDAAVFVQRPIAAGPLDDAGAASVALTIRTALQLPARSELAPLAESTPTPPPEPPRLRRAIIAAMGARAPARRQRAARWQRQRRPGPGPARDWPRVRPTWAAGRVAVERRRGSRADGGGARPRRRGALVRCRRRRDGGLAARGREASDRARARARGALVQRRGHGGAGVGAHARRRVLARDRARGGRRRTGPHHAGRAAGPRQTLGR